VQQKETAGVDNSKASMKSHFQKIGTFIIFDSLLATPKPNKPAITQTHSLPTTFTTTTGPVQSQTTTSTTGHQDLSFNTAFNLIDNKSYYWKVCLDFVHHPFESTHTNHGSIFSLRHETWEKKHGEKTRIEYERCT
jgi:hypothetical protein